MVFADGATILLIDDDRALGELVADALAAAGYRALHEVDGAAGIATAAAVQPALILLDFSLPGLDGAHTAQELRANPVTRRIPIIAITGGAGEVVKTMMAAGCIAYIPKPLDLRELTDLVGRFVRATRRR